MCVCVCNFIPHPLLAAHCVLHSGFPIAPTSWVCAFLPHRLRLPKGIMPNRAPRNSCGFHFLRLTPLTNARWLTPIGVSIIHSDVADGAMGGRLVLLCAMA